MTRRTSRKRTSHGLRPNAAAGNLRQGYLRVKAGKGTIYGPRGGRFTGQVHETVVPKSTEAGWYRVSFFYYPQYGDARIYKLGARVVPSVEAARLRAQVDGMKMKAYASVTSHQKKAQAATAAKYTARDRAEHFALILETKA